MTEEEYKAEWLLGNHQTDYNNCRFADDKIQYCKDWLQRKHIYDYNYRELNNDIAHIVADHKIKIASNPEYRDLLRGWTDKFIVNAKLNDLGFGDIIIPNTVYSTTKLTTTELVNKVGTNSCVIKCTHGSGWNVIKQEGHNITQTMCDKINEWLTLNYAYICGYEAQYENITPGYIIQPLLCDTPIDYGFWCINGEVKGVSLTKKLGKNLEEHIAFVDKDGKRNSWFIGMRPEMGNLPTKFKNNMQNMLPYVETIAKQFDFVRVDMYCVNSKIYFGETTFTPCGAILQKGYV